MGQVKFYQRFNTDKKCFHALRRFLYSGRPVRCSCGSLRLWRSQKPNGCRLYTCRSCRRKWSDLKGTIFERSRVSLVVWFLAIYEVAHHQGISARQLGFRLGVSYKTSWRMLHRIRQALKEHQLGLMLGCVVEADETYVGGRRKGWRGRAAKGKVAVAGVVERGGRLVAWSVPDTTISSLHGLIESHVLVGSRVVTDQWYGYNHLESKGYQHSRVHHSYTWVDGDKHTNTIEGFWSLLKRTFRKVYFHVSKRYIDNYLAEASFRYNLRLEKDRLQATFRACLAPIGS